MLAHIPLSDSLSRRIDAAASAPHLEAAILVLRDQLVPVGCSAHVLQDPGGNIGDGGCQWGGQPWWRHWGGWGGGSVNTHFKGCLWNPPPSAMGVYTLARQAGNAAQSDTVTLS